MNVKQSKRIYWIATGLFTGIMLMSAGLYFFKHEEMVSGFLKLGYPSYIIYPLGVAKILGLMAIWTIKSQTLREWVYAGFFFNLLLAVSSHFYVGDGQFGGSLLGIILLITSYFFDKKRISNSDKQS